MFCACSFIVVLVVSDHHEGSSDVDKLFDAEILSSPKLARIRSTGCYCCVFTHGLLACSCNPVSNTGLKKALDRVVRLACSCCVVSVHRLLQRRATDRVQRDALLHHGVC